MGYKELSFDKDSVFLVGGGAGFIGSNLCEAILEMGYTVRCLDNLSTGKLENIEPFMENERFTFIKGDIRERPGGAVPEVSRCPFYMRKSISGAPLT